MSPSGSMATRSQPKLPSPVRRHRFISICHGAAKTSSSSPSDELDGEVTTANNHTVTLIEGIRENLRVLLVSGAPHSGERAWRNLLKSDASVDLVHFTILRPPKNRMALRSPNSL
jgi:redox-sensitive bicupin YhaK (pirin superfamily)